MELLGVLILLFTALNFVEADAADAASRQIAVLSYNIHHGEGLDGKVDLERIARIIKFARADLVALQEVDVNTKRGGGVDQAKELGRLTGLNAVFGKAIDYENGEYGQAILSRWPISSRSVHVLPQRAGRESRIAVVARIEGDFPGLLFASTHLDHQIEEIRVEQANALNAIFETNRTARAILAGDFNAVPESRTMAILWKGWEDSAKEQAKPTIPAGRPTKRIDYVLFRSKERWKVVRTEVLEEPDASDHRPVLSILQPLD
jgi:endonuclease/exonuclease/phosphatase family metal-dependent hydrolase